MALCLPHGVPRLLSATQPIQILQKPKQITVLYQANHQARQFYIDDPLPTADNAPDPTYNGSVRRALGRAMRWWWTPSAMNDQTWLDDVGASAQRGLARVERYELTEPDRLRVNVTVTDPQTFTAPWEMQLTYKRQPGLRFKEDACSEKFWHPGKDQAG